MPLICSAEICASTFIPKWSYQLDVLLNEMLKNFDDFSQQIYKNTFGIHKWSWFYKIKDAIKISLIEMFTWIRQNTL